MVLDEGGWDRSGKEGAVATDTGDLGGGLEVAEPLMLLRHGGRERGVGAGAETVTGPSVPCLCHGDGAACLWQTSESCRRSEALLQLPTTSHPENILV